MPVGTSFLDLLVPVLAGWGLSNRRIAASRYPGTVCDIPAGFVLRARLGLEKLDSKEAWKAAVSMAPLPRSQVVELSRSSMVHEGQGKMVSSRLAT